MGTVRTSAFPILYVKIIMLVLMVVLLIGIRVLITVFLSMPLSLTILLTDLVVQYSGSVLMVLYVMLPLKTIRL